LPRYFEVHLQFFSVFQYFFCIYHDFSRSALRYSAEPWLGNTGLDQPQSLTDIKQATDESNLKYYVFRTTLCILRLHLNVLNTHTNKIIFAYT
jgi:hypothetical protein